MTKYDDVGCATFACFRWRLVRHPCSLRGSAGRARQILRRSSDIAEATFLQDIMQQRGDLLALAAKLGDKANYSDGIRDVENGRSFAYISDATQASKEVELLLVGTLYIHRSLRGFGTRLSRLSPGGQCFGWQQLQVGPR